MGSAIPHLCQRWPLPKDEHSSVSQPLFPRMWLSIRYSWAPPRCCCYCPQTISPCLAMLRPSWVLMEHLQVVSPANGTSYLPWAPGEFCLNAGLEEHCIFTSPRSFLFLLHTQFPGCCYSAFITSSEVLRVGRYNLMGPKLPQFPHPFWAPLTQPSFITPSADLSVSIAAAKPICFAFVSSVIAFPNLNISRLPPSDLQKSFPVLQSRLLVRLLLTTPPHLAASTPNWNTVSQHGVFYTWYKWVMVCLILWNRKKSPSGDVRMAIMQKTIFSHCWPCGRRVFSSFNIWSQMLDLLNFNADYFCSALLCYVLQGKRVHFNIPYYFFYSKV